MNYKADHFSCCQYDVFASKASSAGQRNPQVTAFFSIYIHYTISNPTQLSNQVDTIPLESVASLTVLIERKRSVSELLFTSKPSSVLAPQRFSAPTKCVCSGIGSTPAAAKRTTVCSMPGSSGHKREVQSSDSADAAQVAPYVCQARGQAGDRRDASLGNVNRHNVSEFDVEGHVVDISVTGPSVLEVQSWLSSDWIEYPCDH